MPLFYKKNHFPLFFTKTPPPHFISCLRACIRLESKHCNALLTGLAKGQQRIDSRLFRMPQLVWCLGLIAVTMPCHYCATFIGCQWDSELSSKLLSSFGSVSMALLQSTYKSYALKWAASVVVPDYGLRQLAASSYQECKCLLHSRALLVTTDRQCAMQRAPPRHSSVSLHTFKRRLKT